MSRRRWWVMVDMVDVHVVVVVMMMMVVVVVVVVGTTHDGGGGGTLTPLGSTNESYAGATSRGRCGGGGWMPPGQPPWYCSGGAAAADAVGCTHCVVRVLSSE
jgi:hypothetical protein